MGRKVSIGVAGTGGGIGTIVASGSGNTLTTAVTNQNLIIDPNGTGITQIVGATQLNAQSELRLADADSSNYIALKAAGTISSNYTLTWPAAVTASNGYVLTSQTDGTLSWASAGGNIPVSDSGSTATVHYPFFGTASGSLPTTLSPLARTNLAFVPSTGELSSDIGRHANIIGSASNSGTVTIRGTSSATKATASVLMTDNVASSSTTTGTLVVTGGVGISGAVYASSGVVSGTLNSLRLENIKTSSHTLELADRDKVVAFNGTSAQTVTIPTNSAVAFPIGSVVYIGRVNTGTLALAASVGVTINKTGSFGSGEEIYCRKRDTDSWVVVDAPKTLTATGGTLAASGGYNNHTYTSGSSTFVVA